VEAFDDRGLAPRAAVGRILSARNYRRTCARPFEADSRNGAM